MILLVDVDACNELLVGIFGFVGEPSYEVVRPIHSSEHQRLASAGSRTMSTSCCMPATFVPPTVQPLLQHVHEIICGSPNRSKIMPGEYRNVEATDPQNPGAVAAWAMGAVFFDPPPGMLD